MSAQSKPVSNDNEANQFPLFYKKPTLLDKNTHEKAGVVQKPHYRFTAESNSAPLNAIEFIEASKFYPIVFSGDKEATFPVAVLGMEQNNYWVSQKGEWKEKAYIPAYVRQYPFILFEQEKDDTVYLCIDEASDFFKAKAAKGDGKLFEEGEGSQLSQNALAFCTEYYNHSKITKQFCADLHKHELLSYSNSKVTLNSGKEISLQGFMTIDEKKFNALSDEVFKEFREKNWLGFIYLSLASSSNWKRLVDLAAEHQPKEG